MAEQQAEIALASPESSPEREDRALVSKQDSQRQKRLAEIPDLELPDGQVPLESAFYVERPPIEADCYEEIVKPSALIRIKAPRQMGKSSLLARILAHAESQGYRTVHLSFQEAEEDCFETLDGLLQWLCASIAYSLGLPAQLDRFWAEPLAKKQKCGNYLQDYIFPKVNAPLVLGLDEVDRVFPYEKSASEFLSMLRAWHDARKNDPNWQRLRLVITHSKEVYGPLDINQSPFNVGLPIELPEFTQAQVADLAQRHGLDLGPQLQDLRQMIGGHPYLVRLALYTLARGRTTWDEFLELAPTQGGPYGEHLRHHLTILMEQEKLRQAMYTVVMAPGPVQIDDTAAFQLRGMGLIRAQGDTAEPLGDLYRRYFRDRIGG